MDQHILKISNQIAHACTLYLENKAANLACLLNVVSGLNSTLDSTLPAILSSQIRVFLEELDEIEYFCPPDQIRNKAETQASKLLIVISNLR